MSSYNFASGHGTDDSQFQLWSIMYLTTEHCGGDGTSSHCLIRYGPKVPGVTKSGS